MRKIKKIYNYLLKRIDYYERHLFGGHLEPIVVWFLISISVIYFLKN